MITNIYVIYNMNKGVKEQPKKKRSWRLLGMSIWL